MSDLGNKEIMSKNLKHYMDILGVSRRKLSADLNIKYTTLSDWINAKTYPRIDKIELLANYFNIQKADLVEKHQINHLNTIEKNHTLSIDKGIARLIRETRQKKQLSFKNISEKIGISESKIIAYEEGLLPFTVPLVFRFAQALDVSFNEIFPHTQSENFEEIPTILYLDEKKHIVITPSGSSYTVTDKEIQQIKDFLTFIKR